MTDVSVATHGKQLNELTKQRGTPEADFMVVYSEVLEDYAEVQEIFIQGRTVFVENLTPEEFSILTAPNAVKTAKQEDQVQDDIEKTKKNVPKSLAKISALAMEIIPDPDRRQKVLMAVQDYQQSLEDFLQEYGTWNYRNNEILTDHDATEAQVQELIDSLNALRLNVYMAFTELYQSLSEACTDDEWKRAAKALKATSNATG